MRESLSRAIVVSAARALLVSEGLTGLSLRRLAGSLDVTAAALYAYVDNKRDLLEAILEEEFEVMIGEFEEVKGANPIERMCLMSWAYVSYARRNPTVFQTMFMFRAQLSDAPVENDLAMATKAFNQARQPLMDAMGQGLIRKGDPLMTHLTIWSAVHGAATVLLLGPNFGLGAATKLTQSVIDSVVRGLATPEGLKLLDKVQLPTAP